MAEDSTALPTQLAAATLNDVASSSPVESLKAEFSDRVPIRSIISRPDGGAGLAGQRVRVGGWVKTGRKADKDAFAFLELNDGSCPGNLQVIVDAAVADLSPLVPTGTCVAVDGVLKLPPAGTRQKVELRVEKLIHVGQVDPAKYPLPKTRLTLERLREHVHLRSRTNTIAAVARIRNALAYATHTFFQKHGFLYVHTPIITTSDCEGAGEMFQVTTLISEADRLEKDLINNPPPSAADIEAAQLVVKEKGDIVAQLKSAKAEKNEISASVSELKIAKEDLARLEERSKLKPGLPKKDGKIDYTHDFFARQAFLTVSGQLQVESYACALSSVYTFGPTFRAENSHTSRHLAEFWMVEPEIAFAELKDDMNCAEAYVRFLCQWLLDNCLDDMEFMADKFDKTCIERLRMVSSTPFERISYTEAVELLEEAVKNGQKFENKSVKWGIDLASEHERYLTEVKFQKPVIVYNYPKDIKAFYMKVNDDCKTVAAMDVLVPKVGELIGGSQREERYEVIQQRIQEMGLPLEPYEWYLDLVDLGPMSLGEINSLLTECKKVIWIGPVKFSNSNQHTNGASKLAQMLDLLSQSNCDLTIVGNMACKVIMQESSSISEFNMLENASVVWEFLKGRKLPGVTALDRAYPFEINWNATYCDPMQPLVVDIGSGNGLFILGMAIKRKDLNFLGLEINEKLVRRCLDSVQRSTIKNGYFIATNATSTFRSIVSSYPGKLVLVSIQCPNPDFNKPEYRWRMLQRALVEAVADLLTSDGKVFLQSDIEAVAVGMREQFLKYSNGKLSVVHDQDAEINRGWLEENPFGVRSDWEQHVIDRGAPMYRLMLSKSTGVE